MRHLFDWDSPVFQALTRLADLVALSLLCLVCCVPVVTIGPALTALYKTVYDLTLDRCGGAAKTFFRAFRDNFGQGLAAGMLGLAALASVVCGLLLLGWYDTGNARTALTCLVYLMGFLALGALAYLFPLIGRYENRMAQHIQNAVLLMLRYLPRTIAMVFLHLLPVFLLLFFPDILISTLAFWLLAGPGVVVQADAFLLRPVFDSLEQSGPGSGGAAEKPEEDSLT